MVHQNSPTVEFGQEKIEGNLRRAKTEPSLEVRRAITEPSVDFRKANTKLSMHFWRANTETCWKKNVNPSKRVGKDRVFLGLPGLLLGISLGLAGLLLGICLRLRLWEIPWSSPASPRKTLPSSFTYVNPVVVLRRLTSIFSHQNSTNREFC